MTIVQKLYKVDLYELDAIEDGARPKRPCMSRAEPSVFYFKVSHDGHGGAAEISVELVPSDDDRNPYYQPKLRLHLCCPRAHLEPIMKACQIVYDESIQPIQWEFSDASYTHTHPPPVDCQDFGKLAVFKLQKTSSFWAIRKKYELAQIEALPVEEAKKISLFNTIQLGGPIPEIDRDVLGSIGIARRTMHQHRNGQASLDTIVSLLKQGKCETEFLSKASPENWWAWALFANCRLARKSPGSVLGVAARKREFRAANSIYALNLAANMMCVPATSSSSGCYCGLKLYTWFGEASERLANRNNERKESTMIFSTYLAALLRDVLDLDLSIKLNIASAVSAICNLDYQTVCTRIGLNNLAGLSNQKLGSEVVCPTHGSKLNEVQRVAYSTHLYYPDLSAIETQILSASRWSFIGCKYKPISTHGIQVFKIECPAELKNLMAQIAKHTKLHFVAQFKQELRWRGTLMLQKNGCLRPDGLTSTIVPLLASHPHRAKINFEIGDDRRELGSVKWWQPTIIDRSVGFGIGDCTLVYFILQYLHPKEMEKKEQAEHESVSPEQEWRYITPQIWNELFDNRS